MKVKEVKEDRVEKKKRWNLFNSEHKVSSEVYKENWERIFGGGGKRGGKKTE